MENIRNAKKCPKCGGTWMKWDFGKKGQFKWCWDNYCSEYNKKIRCFF